MKPLFYTSGSPPGLLRKAATIIVAVVVAGLTLMFSAVLLAILLILGAAVWCYLWWKMRGIRKQMQDAFPRSVPTGSEAFEGNIIEGEAIRVDEPGNRLGH